MNTNNKTSSVKNTRKNKSWFQNPDQLKTPKVFNVTMLRSKDGSFHLLGNGSAVMIRKNQHVGEWVNVDIRDLASELRSNPIKAF